MSKTSSELRRSWFHASRRVLGILVLLLSPGIATLYGADPFVSRNLEKAQTFVEQKKYTEALPFVTAAVERTGSPEAYYLRGHVLLNLSRFSGARADAKTLVRVFPEDWRGYYLRARVYLEDGSGTGSTPLLTALKNTLKRKPDHERARMYLGKVRASRGQFRKALARFRAVSDTVRAHPDTGEVAARVAFLQGKKQLALDFASAVLEMLPQNRQAGRIRSFVKEGVDPAAEGHIREVQETEDERDRFRLIEQLETKYPDVAHVQLFCGRSYLDRGDLGRALKLAERAENEQPDAWTAFFLGRVQQRRGKFEEAASWFRKGTRRRTSFPEARLRGGICLSKSGRHAAAIKQFRRVSDRVSVRPAASRELVRCCLKTGHLVYARRRLPSLTLSAETRTEFRRKLEERLSERKERERESFANRVYENSLYGLEANLDSGWSYLPEAGRPEVVALFVNVEQRDRFFIMAERRLPSFSGSSLKNDRVPSELRSYVTSTVLQQETNFQFLRDRLRTDLPWRAAEFVFQHREQARFLHSSVVFHGKWMISVYYYRSGKGTSTRDRMKATINGIIMKSH